MTRGIGNIVFIVNIHNEAKSILAIDAITLTKLFQDLSARHDWVVIVI